MHFKLLSGSQAEVYIWDNPVNEAIPLPSLGKDLNSSLMVSCSIESVDSICRDNIYDNTKKFSNACTVNLQAFISMFTFSSIFMTNNMPSCAKTSRMIRNRKLPNDQNVYCKSFSTKQQHFTLNIGPVHHFSQLSSNFMKHSEDILNYGFAWDAILLLVNMATKRSHDNQWIHIYTVP